MEGVLQTSISPDKFLETPGTDLLAHGHPWVAIAKDDPFSPEMPRFVTMEAGDTIRAVVARAEFEPFAVDYVRAVLDGDEIPREDWARIMPARDQLLFLEVVPEGDSAGKILNAALTVFVTALSFFFPPFALFAPLALGVGSLLINTLLPPPQPDSLTAEPIFRLDGASNQFRPFQPIPLSVGRRRVFPDLGGRGYQEVVGDVFFQRTLVVWGPIGVNVDNIRIGETPLEALDGVQVEHRFKADDPHPRLYPSQVFQEQVGAALISTGDFERRRTIPGASQSVLVYGFPTGLGRRTRRGRKRVASVTILIRFRRVEIDPNTGNETFGAYTQLTRTVTRTSPGEPFFQPFTVSFPEPAIWDVETRRTDIDDDPDDDGISDDIRWELFDSRRPGRPILRDDVAYSTFRFRATDEVNGRIATINGDLERLKPVFPDAVLDLPDLRGVDQGDLVDAQPTSNPWEIILWMYRNGFEQRDPLEDEGINWPSFALAARYARDNGLTYDQIFTGEITLEDAVAEAEFAGQGRAVFIGTQLTAVIDGPQIAPVMLFSDRHVRNVRVTQSYPDQPDALRVTWNDGDDGDRDREDIIYAPGQTAATARRFRQMQVPGVTNWPALQAVIFRTLNNATLQQRRVSFEVPVRVMDAAAARFGARLSFSSQVISQGRASGYIRAVNVNPAGDVTSVVFDEPVELVPGEDLAFRFRRLGQGSSETVSAAQLIEPVLERVRTYEVALRAPIPAGIAPASGDVFQFGLLGVERMDGLLDRFESVDENWVRLNLVDYAPERFSSDGFVDVPRPPLIDLPSILQPPALALVSVAADADSVAIQFRPLEGPGFAAFGFKVWRAHVDAEVVPPVRGEYEALPDLSVRDRILIAPAGLRGEMFVYRIAAIGVDGQLGPALDIDPTASFDGLPEIQNLSVVAQTEALDGGSARPVLVVTAEPVLDLGVEHFVVAVRRVDNGAGEELAEADRPLFAQGGFADADTPTLVLRGLVPGGLYEVQAYLRGARQEVSLAVIAPVILLPETEIALSARDPAAGGLIEAGFTAAQTGIGAAQAASMAAAAAAQNALDGVADQGVVINQVTERVSEVEGDVSTERTRINALQSSLGDTQALVFDVQDAVDSEAETRAAAISGVRAGLNSEELLSNSDFSIDPIGVGIPTGWSRQFGAFGDSVQIAQAELGQGQVFKATVTANSTTHQIATTITEIGANRAFRATVAAQLLSGLWQGAGVIVASRNAANSTVLFSFISLHLEPDDLGEVSNDSAALRRWTFDFTAPPETETLRVFISTNAIFGNVPLSMKTVDWHEVSVTPDTGVTPEVFSLREAVFDENGSSVRTVISGSVPGADVVANFEAFNRDGVAQGRIGLAADVLTLFNRAAGVFAPALQIFNGVSTFFGALNALAGIFVGQGRWPVALEPRRYALLDGESVDFGYDFGAPATLTAITSNLPALSAGEAYTVTFANNDGSGFTMIATRSTPGTPTDRIGTVDAAGTGGLDRQMNAINAEEAFDGIYEFTFTALVRTAPAPSSSFAEGLNAVEIFIHDGGGFRLIDTISVNVFGAGDTLLSVTRTVQVDYTGPVRNSGVAFGVAVTDSSGSQRVSDLARVKYTTQTPSSVSSATAGGQRVIVTATPRNA